MAVKREFPGTRPLSYGDIPQYREIVPYGRFEEYRKSQEYRESPAYREAVAREEKARKITCGAVIAGLACALVAGLIVVLSLPNGGTAAVRPARATPSASATERSLSPQALAAGQLEKAASGLQAATANVYKYQVACARTGRTRQVCAALSPSLAHFSATTATFDTGNFGLTDHRANSLIATFEDASIGTVEASSAVTATWQWQSMVTAYKALIKRCHQLGAGS
jgi:hypothetical protein